ncbi:MAG: hypothetical protein BGO41_05820 [Clostridiales bacterium 38-18]|nr:MAG: hypothetical protein BGO41_05820 [Clostridiales bacterium 38-18]
MSYYRKPPIFDLGELNIENLFITDFMPLASGTYVKVYLLGYLFSKDSEPQYDHRMLASMLSLPLQDVHDAWQYWEKQGIVTRHLIENSKDYEVEFHSLRSLYIENTFASDNKSHSNKKVKPTASPIVDQTFKQLNHTIEKLIGQPLTFKDVRDISDFYDNYTHNTELIIKAFEYSYLTKGIRKTNYVKATLELWLKNNLTSSEEVDSWLSISEARQTTYKEVLKTLGVRYRQVSASEASTIDKWLDEYGCSSDDLIKILFELTKKTMNPNFNYIDNVLSSLKKSGSVTFLQFEKQNSEFSQAKATGESKPNRKKNYTIEKESNYSEEELEALLLNKKPSRGKQ